MRERWRAGQQKFVVKGRGRRTAIAPEPPEPLCSLALNASLGEAAGFGTNPEHVHDLEHRLRTPEVSYRHRQMRGLEMLRSRMIPCP